MESWQGKQFSITDPKGVKTVIYEVYVTKKDYLSKYPKYTIERIKSTEQLLNNDMTKKTFYVEDPQENGNRLLIFSFAKEKVIINQGLLIGNEVKIMKKPIPFKYEKLFSEEKSEYRDIQYTPNLKRAITVIDPETAEEVKPVLYFDEKTNEVKGKCKLKPYKAYFAFELKENN